MFKRSIGGNGDESTFSQCHCLDPQALRGVSLVRRATVIRNCRPCPLRTSKSFQLALGLQRLESSVSLRESKAKLGPAELDEVMPE